MISIWSYITDAEYENDMKLVDHLSYECDTISILYVRSKNGIQIMYEINVNVTAMRTYRYLIPVCYIFSLCDAA